MKIGIRGELLQEARTLALILATACCQVRWADAMGRMGVVEVKAVGITQIEI